MRIPPPLKPIDVDEAWEQIQGGMSAAAYARKAGHSRGGLYSALRRAGLRVPRRRRVQRDAIDRRLYAVWHSLRTRCDTPSSPLYAQYGALGIRVCSAWREFPAFRDWARGNGYKPGLALLLRVRSRGFSPGNCRWGSRSEVVQAWLVRSHREAPARTGKPIPWKRVHQLYVGDHLTVAETARRVGASHRGVKHGLVARAWFRERTPFHAMEHGIALHKAWHAMRGRAREVVAAGSAGRSSKIDPAWDDFGKFHAWALTAGYRKGLCLTRLDRSRAFGPKNCAWLSPSESVQFHRPKKATARPRWQIRAFGETKSAADWGRDFRCKVSMSGLLHRLRNGWDAEEAITTIAPRRNAKSRSVTAFGMTASLAAWAADRRARVTAVTIGSRLKAGMAPEDAITAPAFSRGVVRRR